MVVTVVVGRPRPSNPVVMRAARLIGAPLTYRLVEYSESKVPSTVIGAATVMPVAVSATATVVRPGLVAVPGVCVITKAREPSSLYCTEPSDPLTASDSITPGASLTALTVIVTVAMLLSAVPSLAR